MSEENKEKSTGSKKSKLSLILVLLNTVMILAALGSVLYTRVLFKRPAITEENERQRLAQQKKGQISKDAEPGKMSFDAFTVNVHPKEKPSNDPDKIHYLTLSFELQIRDQTLTSEVEKARPVLMDRFIAWIGKKPYEDLNTVQGRYLLRSEMIDMINETVGKPLAMDLYFTQFLVQ